jgi:hypothetical protein
LAAGAAPEKDASFSLFIITLGKENNTTTSTMAAATTSICVRRVFSAFGNY